MVDEYLEKVDVADNEINEGIDTNDKIIWLDDDEVVDIIALDVIEFVELEEIDENDYVVILNEIIIITDDDDEVELQDFILDQEILELLDVDDDDEVIDE